MEGIKGGSAEVLEAAQVRLHNSFWKKDCLTQTFPVFSLSKHQSRSVIIPPPHTVLIMAEAALSLLSRELTHTLHEHVVPFRCTFTILREVGGVRNLSPFYERLVESETFPGPTRTRCIPPGITGRKSVIAVSPQNAAHIGHFWSEFDFFSGTLTFDDFQKYRIKRVGYQLAVLRSSLPEGPAASFNHA